jgi:hypothetical protein
MRGGAKETEEIGIAARDLIHLPDQPNPNLPPRSQRFFQNPKLPTRQNTCRMKKPVK